jgi:hypothetical protein
MLRVTTLRYLLSPKDGRYPVQVRSTAPQTQGPLGSDFTRGMLTLADQAARVVGLAKHSEEGFEKTWRAFNGYYWVNIVSNLQSKLIRNVLLIHRYERYVMQAIRRRFKP